MHFSWKMSFCVVILLSSVSVIPLTFAQVAPFAIFQSPKKQVEQGLSADLVKCNDDLILIKKLSDNSPACVKTQTAQKLVERGWGTTQISVIEKEQKTQSTLQNPVQISTQIIPTNPEVGERVGLDLTIKNKANYTIYYAATCGDPQLYVSITPADIIEMIPGTPCACLASPPVRQLNPNDTIHWGGYPLSCFDNRGTILKLGVIVAKSTFLWGTTSQNPESNSTSMLSTFNLSAKEEKNGTLTNPVIISQNNAVKILSISMSPDPLKVGDTPYFTLAYQNISDKPIYHMEGCQAYSLSYTLSPETNLQQIPRVGPLPTCADYETLIQPNQVITDNAVPSLNVVGFKIIKAGTLNVTMALNLRNLSGEGFTNYIQFQINATQ